MAYYGELASKVNHTNIVTDVEILRSLRSMTSSEKIGDCLITGPFTRPPRPLVAPIFPETVITIDGGIVMSPSQGTFSQTGVTFGRIAWVEMDTRKYENLAKEGTISASKMSGLIRDSGYKNFVLPARGSTLDGFDTVGESFRSQCHKILSCPIRVFEDETSTVCLMETLAMLSSMKEDVIAGVPDQIEIECPTCGLAPLPVEWRKTFDKCTECGSVVFGADVLMLWPEVHDYINDSQPALRFLNVVERILSILIIENIRRNYPHRLGKTCIVTDGPLAVFGGPHWLHNPIDKYLRLVSEASKDAGWGNPLVIGLQKSGQVVEHFESVKAIIEPDSVMVLNDDYRRLFIGDGYVPERGFGYESYYGSTFAYHSKYRDTYVFCLPFPIARSIGQEQFSAVTGYLESYADLPRALSLIDCFRCDRYNNAIVPVALANDMASINPANGGRSLDSLVHVATLSSSQAHENVGEANNGRV